METDNHTNLLSTLPYERNIRQFKEAAKLFSTQQVWLELCCGWKVVAREIGLQQDYTEYCCFASELDSWTRTLHGVRRDWLTVRGNLWSSKRKMCNYTKQCLKCADSFYEKTERNCNQLVESMLPLYRKYACNMSLKIHFLHFHLDFSPELWHGLRWTWRASSPRHNHDWEWISGNLVNFYDRRLFTDAHQAWAPEHRFKWKVKQIAGSNWPFLFYVSLPA